MTFKDINPLTLNFIWIYYFFLQNTYPTLSVLIQVASFVLIWPAIFPIHNYNSFPLPPVPCHSLHSPAPSFQPQFPYPSFPSRGLALLR